MIRMIRLMAFTILITSALSLSACEGTKETLGIGQRQSPDEFAVLKNEPLTLPPNYNLRPPRPGAPRPQSKDADQKAKAAVTGINQNVEPASGGQENDVTDGESLFLKQAGADIANPNIRDEIDSISYEIDKSKQPVAKRLLGLGGDAESAASIVDAKAESERIQGNLKKGESVTKGETPSIDPE